MGYTTDFRGQVAIMPPLSEAERAYLNAFSRTRRVRWRDGDPYAVDRLAEPGPEVLDDGTPPEDQPGLWCDWVLSEDGTAIIWNGAEKFYEAPQWMQYLIDHFLGPDPIARRRFPERFAFLRGHTLDGQIEAQGEDPDDRWALLVESNSVFILTYETVVVEKERTPLAAAIR